MPIKYSAIDYNSEDSPFFRDEAVRLMREKWEIIRAATSGTDYLHRNADVYLPRELGESAKGEKDQDPWLKRVNLSVLTPFFAQMIDRAARMVLKDPIRLEGGDEWWEKVFRLNVDGQGTSLNRFALGRLNTALLYGMSTMLVDAQRRTALSGADELNALRPFFISIDPHQYLGHRREGNRPEAPLTMFRYEEELKKPKGQFGEEYVAAARLIVPGAYEVFEARGNSSSSVEIGIFDLDYIPIVDFYSLRVGDRCAFPPLADVAYLNISHYRRLADLTHGLHAAAQQLLVLEEYDQDSVITGSYRAIRMERGAKAYYVKHDAGSWAAQGELLDRLETYISHLGATTLVGQKRVAEAADSKRLDYAQTNSVLSDAAMELEGGLTKAFEMASDYNGKRPPKVVISKDFDFYKLLGQDVAALGKLEENGQIPTRVMLKALAEGDWLSKDENIDKLVREVAALKAKKALENQRSSTSDSETEPAK